MSTDSFKGPAPCSSDRAHLRLTRHLFLSRPSLSVTQTCSQTHQFHSDAGSECVGPEYANMQMLCCQYADSHKTARRQNCPTFLQNNFILSRRDLTEWLCEEHPVYRMHLLTFYRFTRGIIIKKKKEHGNDSSLLPLQGCLEWQGQTKVVRYSHFWK